jgi:hypothetical protein
MELIFNSASYIQFRLDSFKESPFDTKRVKCTQKKVYIYQRLLCLLLAINLIYS